MLHPVRYRVSPDSSSAGYAFPGSGFPLFPPLRAFFFLQPLSGISVCHAHPRVLLSPRKRFIFFPRLRNETSEVSLRDRVYVPVSGRKEDLSVERSFPRDLLRPARWPLSSSFSFGATLPFWGEADLPPVRSSFRSSAGHARSSSIWCLLFPRFSLPLSTFKQSRLFEHPVQCGDRPQAES